MKRTPLTRSTPLRRHRGVRKVNRRRRAKRFARDFGVAATIVREQPCCVCLRKGREQLTRTEAHHEPPRSCGGTSDDVLPLCGGCHRARHRLGVETFWARADVDWRGVIERMRKLVKDAEQPDSLPVSPLLGMWE